jgi:DNA topoisomerase I
MARYLVVVESPAKAKTINKFLGRNYIVKPSFGSVRDLPKSEMGVDIDNNFEPKYVVMREERTRKAVKDLKDAAEKVEEILLASDPDREGEAIAWHVAEILKSYKKTQDLPAKRVVFHEITKKSVQDAIKNPRDINSHLVDAQQARRVLDRLVGYKLSPLLDCVVSRRGMSAGRVQSVAVRMVVEREHEIRAFVSQEYWSLMGLFLTPREDRLKAQLFKRNGQTVKVGDPGHVKSKDEMDQILADLEGADYRVASVERKEVRRYPSPPFITSTLQQEASRKLRMTPAATMAVAQQLYQGLPVGDEGQVGLITYMRTDSTRLSGEALSDVRAYIGRQFDQGMLPEKPNFYKSKKSAQEAHEAIRPTSTARTPESVAPYLDERQLRVYTLIWQRFVACQMAPAVLDQTVISIEARQYEFRASGSVIKFAGFLKLYEESTDDTPEDENGAGLLPEVKDGEQVAAEELKPEQHFTKPPARYSEASLIRAMEENGIGRPSTYAPTINTILTREYVAKDKGRLVPTELGETVNEWLVAHFPDILSIGFTAHLEEHLDEVEEGNREWHDLTREFYGDFAKDLAVTEEKMVRQVVGENPRCPECGDAMELRESWRGLYLGCVHYPTCKGTLPIKKTRAEPIPTDEICPECGSPMVIREGRFGRFMACSAYPKCKVSFNVDEHGQKIEKPAKEPPKRTEETCPECKKGKLLIRKSRKGEEFYGCENYPKCKYTRPMELNLECPKPDCQGQLVPKRARGRRLIGCDKCDFTAFGAIDRETPCPQCANAWTLIQKPKGKPQKRVCPVPTCTYEEELVEDTELAESEK